MNNREIELSTFIKNNRDIPWIDVLNAFEPGTKVNETSALLKKFLKEGLIAVSPYSDRPPHGMIRIAPDGVAALLTEQEKQRKTDKPRTVDHAAHPAEKKFPKAFKAICAIIAALAGLATIATAVLGFIDYFA